MATLTISRTSHTPLKTHQLGHGDVPSHSLYHTNREPVTESMAQPLSTSWGWRGPIMGQYISRTNMTVNDHHCHMGRNWSSASRYRHATALLHNHMLLCKFECHNKHRSMPLGMAWKSKHVSLLLRQDRVMQCLQDEGDALRGTSTYVSCLLKSTAGSMAGAGAATTPVERAARTATALYGSIADVLLHVRS